MTQEVQKPKVLIVEDTVVMQKAYQRRLSPFCTVLQAFTLAEGERMFRENPDIRAVVMDGNVDGKNGEFDSLPLTKLILETFIGPIIATSGECREAQLKGGCTHECDKSDVPAFIKQMLGV